MGVCCRSGGGCCMPVLSRSWRRWLGTGWPTRSNGWLTMPCGGGVGQGPGLLPAGGGKAGNAPRFVRRSPPSSRPWQALAHLPDSRADDRVQALDLRLGLRGALNALGEAPAAPRPLREAAPWPRALDDRTRLGTGLARMASLLRWRVRWTAPSLAAACPGARRRAPAAASRPWKHPIAWVGPITTRETSPGGPEFGANMEAYRAICSARPGSTNSVAASSAPG